MLFAIITTLCDMQKKKKKKEKEEKEISLYSAEQVN